MEPALKVDGLKELRSALKKIDADLPKELRVHLKDIGTRVANAARSKVPTRSGKAAASLRAGVSGNNAYIAGGKASVPYFGWLDFGGTLKASGGRRNTQHRESPKGGRYLYPAIAENSADIEHSATAAFDAIGRKAGLL